MKAGRIIQVSSYYPPHLGGQENAVHDLAGQLAVAGHRVRVLTSDKGSGTRGTAHESGVLVSRLRGFVFGHAPIMPWFPVALFRSCRSGSVVHLHVGQAFTPEMVWLVAKLRRCPYVAQLHIDFEPSGPAGRLLPLYKRLILQRVLQSAAAVIVLNEKTLRTVRDRYRRTDNVHIMSNGIDEVYFTLERPPLPRQPPETLHLLFVGRLSRQKNLVVLLEALKLTGRSVRLDIVGDGEEREALQRAVARHKLTNVTMHGRLSREQVRELYTTCDALAIPSLYEAQPLVLLEAMAARIPIIGTDVIGVAEHIKDIGIIVQPTPEGLADGLEAYYTQYAKLPRMVERGYTAAEKLRWAHNLKKYEALYETVATA